MSIVELVKVDDLRNGQDPSPAWSKAKDGEIIIRCGKCKQVLCLSHLHFVDSNGVITPSLYHHDGKCEWHVWGKLLNYSK